MTATEVPSAPELSLVVPMFNEEDSVGPFLDRVRPILDSVTQAYEIICVDDGSRDGTRDRIIAARGGDRRVKLISLSRNFGKEAALTAGLGAAVGAAVVPIDVDLQDPPEVIPDMVEKWREGFEMVLATREDRASDPTMKRWTSRAFYRVIGSIADIPIPADAGDFRLMDRQVVDAVMALPERARFMKGLYAWVGFRQARIGYVRPPRRTGVSKWPLWKLWNFALDGIFSFSMTPLRLWTYLGLAVALFALAYILFILVRVLLMGIEVPGYASLLVVVLFFSGLNMVGLGIIGEYLGRTFLETKRRPLFVVRERVGFDQDDDRGDA